LRPAILILRVTYKGKRKLTAPQYKEAYFKKKKEGLAALAVEVAHFTV
jgi:hypothetical protein